MSLADHRLLAGDSCEVRCCCINCFRVFSSFAYTDVDDNLIQLRDFHVILVAELFAHGVFNLRLVQIV